MFCILLLLLFICFLVYDFCRTEHTLCCMARWKQLHSRASLQSNICCFKYNDFLKTSPSPELEKWTTQRARRVPLWHYVVNCLFTWLVTWCFRLLSPTSVAGSTAISTAHDTAWLKGLQFCCSLQKGFCCEGFWISLGELRGHFWSSHIHKISPIIPNILCTSVAGWYILTINI